MPRRKRSKDQFELLDLRDRLSTAPCVPAIREAVAAWRQGGYKGVTDTTRELLNYWFHTDHRLYNGRPFRYYDAQREAIETLIYVYEVEKIRSRKALLERFAYDTKELRLPPFDDFARFCIKMATGSGKTKVMSLAIAWQYFNAVREDDQQYAKTFLIIAPNVIVFERLKTDFESGRIFRIDPVFPKHFSLMWDMEFYMRGDPERASSIGALYLTNIQQFYERESLSRNDEPEIMTAVLGSKPQTQKIEITDFDQRIAKREGLLLVVNDEAHHTHDEQNEWNNVIRRLHADRPLAAQLDFSATPRYSKGALFSWTISDYPLKQAIIDGIVKRPLKGISRVEEAKSDIATVRYKAFLIASVERWKEYNEQLKFLHRKPVLFIMMNTTEEAEDVADWLRQRYPEEFAGDKTLVIHTDRSGEISKKDLDKARKVAREVDSEESPVNAIVSVLMLREGWDVRNVTVVVGLRPYTAKANILPEQTIGRGLRLMFRDLSSDYQERVDIIGNKAFLSFVEDLEKIENIKFETFELGKERLKIFTIMPVPEKMDVDIGIPELTPILMRKKSLAQEIAAIDVMKFETNPLPLVEKDEDIKSFIYEGVDIITKEKILEREYQLPPVQTPEEVIGYYARLIAHDLKLPLQFAALAPKIKEFFHYKAFGRAVDLYEPLVIKAMSTNVARYVVCHEFEKRLRDAIVEETEPELLSQSRLLSTTPPFPFSKQLLESRKTVFNFVACDNEFERSFAKFLDGAEDVAAFAKLPEQFGFCIQYTDTRANIRNYYPDFVVKSQENKFWIIETKGREDVDVILKDQAAQLWCEKATSLTNSNWRYLKVPQQEFEKLHPETFEELCIALDH
ncbi:MAG: DEAD/DEAH box helicase family protein [candidate division KSB1 bacterium]|nr:DEAD/DEAH box helicase family protein [candidate division KSB1 bacterium]